MNIRILWWKGVAGDPSRGNKDGFEELGHNVELLENEFGVNAFHYGADLLFCGVPGSVGLIPPTIPSIVQLGGYGVNTMMPGGRAVEVLGAAINNATIATVLDPSFYWELQQSPMAGNINWSKVRVVPNGYTRRWEHIKEPFLNYERRKDDKRFIVFNPAGDSFLKKPEIFVKAAKILHENDVPIDMWLLSRSKTYSNPLEWLDIPNLTVISKVPYEDMPALYSMADVLAPFSANEIFPNTVIESFSMGKPTITNNMGWLTTVKHDFLEEMQGDFGMTVEQFEDVWVHHTRGKIDGETHHYLQAKDAITLADTICKLYDDRDFRQSLGEEAKSWSKKWWTMKDKCRVLIDLVK